MRCLLRKGQTMPESIGRHLHTLKAGHLPCICDDNGQTGHRTNDNRIDECAGHRYESLLGRPFCFGGGSGDRRGAEAGLVREYAAGDTVLHGHHDRRSGEAARCSSTGEGIRDDEHYGIRHSGDIHDDEPQRYCDIGQSHERDDAGSDFGDTLQTTDGDRCDEHRQDDIGGNFREAKRQLDTVDDGVDLRECTDTEESDEDAGYGEEGGQWLPFFTHAVADVEHRAAGDLAFFINRAEFDGEQAFGVFRGHAEERCYPHPEYGARAADFHGRRHADDVAGTDGSGQGHAQRLEARYIAFAVVLGPGRSGICQFLLIV